MNPADALTIFVMGMHRSGTSMVMNLLRACGIYLGPSREMVPPDPSNPLGHWELSELPKLNEAIFKIWHGSWDRPPLLPADWTEHPALKPIEKKAGALLRQKFKNLAVWGLKDPRFSFTFPFWKRFSSKAKVIVCLRHPMEVAKSLAKRNGLTIGQGLDLCRRYTEAVFQNTHGVERMVVRYEDYFRAPEEEIHRLLDFVSLQVSDHLIAEAKKHIDPALRHHVSQEEAEQWYQEYAGMGVRR